MDITSKSNQSNEMESKSSNSNQSNEMENKSSNSNQSNEKENKSSNSNQSNEKENKSSISNQSNEKENKSSNSNQSNEKENKSSNSNQSNEKEDKSSNSNQSNEKENKSSNSNQSNEKENKSSNSNQSNEKENKSSNSNQSNEKENKSSNSNQSNEKENKSSNSNQSNETENKSSNSNQSNEKENKSSNSNQSNMKENKSSNSNQSNEKENKSSNSNQSNEKENKSSPKSTENSFSSPISGNAESDMRSPEEICPETFYQNATQNETRILCPMYMTKQSIHTDEKDNKSTPNSKDSSEIPSSGNVEIDMKPSDKISTDTHEFSKDKNGGENNVKNVSNNATLYHYNYVETTDTEVPRDVRKSSDTNVQDKELISDEIDNLNSIQLHTVSSDDGKVERFSKDENKTIATVQPITDDDVNLNSTLESNSKIDKEEWSLKSNEKVGEITMIGSKMSSDSSKGENGFDTAITIDTVRQVSKEIYSEDENFESTSSDFEFKTVKQTRVVLIGITGCGKSATGNTLLGNKKFKTSAGSTSTTGHCDLGRRKFEERYLEVVDTPGLFDTDRSEDDVKRELARSIALLSPGPHAFLIVIRVGRFNIQEQNTVDTLVKLFGEDRFLKYSMVVITRKDELEEEEMSLDEYIRQAPPGLKEVIKKCGNRCFAINNRLKKTCEVEKQVKELLLVIDDMVDKCGGTFYTHALFEKVEQERRERLEAEKKRIENENHKKEQELRQREEKVLEAERENLRRKHELEVETLKAEMKSKIERKQFEAQKEKEKYQRLLRKIEKERERDEEEKEERRWRRRIELQQQKEQQSACLIM